MPFEPRSYRVGQATITRIPEFMLTGVTPGGLYPDWDPAVLAALPAWLPAETMADPGDGSGAHVLMSVHAWLVQDRGRTILIDTGAGNGKARPKAPLFDRLSNPFLERLRAAGVEPEDVDHVLLTHLHVDHVGWNTRFDDGGWVPTFPNARHLFSRVEYDYFTDPANEGGRNLPIQQDSVVPVVEAGLADMIAIDGSEPVEGFTFHPTPGHSIDHASIAFRSGGEQALFAADVLHHPLGVYRPRWNSVFDLKAEESRRSRLWALDFAADRGALVFTSHFPASSAGTVERSGDGFEWRFR